MDYYSKSAKNTPDLEPKRNDDTKISQKGIWENITMTKIVYSDKRKQIRIYLLQK